MAEFPYTTVPPKLAQLIQLIADRGIPKTFNNTELKGFGFKSSNDSSLLRVLKSLNVIDDKGTPTTEWTALRDKTKRSRVVARLVKACYEELYERLPDAHLQSDQALADVIAANSNLGKDTVTKAVLTFKSLVGISDFTVLDHTGNDEPEASRSQEDVDVNRVGKASGADSKQSRGHTINITLNLHFPENASVEVIEAIFVNMKNNLLDA